MLREIEDGRFNLSMMEYYRLLCLDVAVSEIMSCESELWERLGKVKNGRRDIRMLKAVGYSLYLRLLDTVPEKKIPTLYADLDGAKMTVHINAASKSNADSLLSIRESDLNELLNYVVERNCLLCDNTSRAKVKGCKVRKLIDRVKHYDCDPLPDGRCPFEGIDSADKLSVDKQ